MLNSARLLRERSGRRAGATSTRDAILKSARKLFATKGYEATSIRAVAAGAGVDPALVGHFFGPKDQLFGASIELPVDPAAIEGLFEGDKAQLGRRVATFYVQTIFRERAGTMLSLLRSVANPEAAAMLRRAIERVLVAAVVRALPGDEPALRGELVASHMMGLFFARKVLGVAPLAAEDDERLIELVAPALQHYLTAPLPKRRRR